MSLAARLIITIAAVLTAMFALAGLLSYWQALRRVQIETGAALAQAQGAVRSGLESAMGSATPQRDLSHIVRSFNGSRHVRASVVDSQGHIETSTLAPPVNDVPDWFVRLLIQPLQSRLVPLTAEFAPALAIRLEADPRGEIDELWADVKLDALIGAALCVLVLALIALTLKRALAPLPHLTRAFETIGSGDYTPRVEPEGPAEFLSLCRGFNEMAEQLTAMDRLNRRLGEELAAVQAQERAELARDLHDGIGSLLFAVDVDAMTIGEIGGADRDPAIQSRVKAIRSSAAEMKARVRALLDRLRPDVALDLGLGHAVGQLVSCARLRHPGIRFETDLADEGWGAEIDSVLYHVIRESVNNALRHARPGRIAVSAEQRADGTIRVEIADDGCGFSARAQPGGFGIVGMRERLAAHAGTLTIEAGEDGTGTTVVARLPVQGKAGLRPLPRTPEPAHA